MAQKLLLADDSITIQRVVELTFADEDVQVVAVGDGQQAIERIESERPDIILVDADMPQRNGYEIAAFVKGTPHLAHIPVVLLTGRFDRVDDQRARAAGCVSSLAKPFEPQALVTRVRELLGSQAPPAVDESLGEAVWDVPPLPLPLPAPRPLRPADFSERDASPAAKPAAPAPQDYVKVLEDADVAESDEVEPTVAPEPTRPRLFVPAAAAAPRALTPAAPAPRPVATAEPVAPRAFNLSDMPRAPQPIAVEPERFIEKDEEDSYEIDERGALEETFVARRTNAPTQRDMPPVAADLEAYFDRLDAAFAGLAAEVGAPAETAAPPAGGAAELRAGNVSRAASSSALAAASLSPAATMEGRAAGQELSTPSTAAGPALADMFATLLAEEQGEAAPGLLLRRDLSASGDIVEQVTRQVIARLADPSIREIVHEIVRSVAKELVREEVGRLRASAGVAHTPDRG